MLCMHMCLRVRLRLRVRCVFACVCRLDRVRVRVIVHVRLCVGMRAYMQAGRIVLPRALMRALSHITMGCACARVW